MQAQEIEKRIEGIDLSITKQAKENEEGMRKQAQEINIGIQVINQIINKQAQENDMQIEISIRNQTQEIDQRLARLEKLILDMNTKLSHNK